MFRTIGILIGILHILAGMAIGAGVYVLDSDGWSWKSCSINVTAKNPLDPKKVLIKYGLHASTINRKSDADLFTDHYTASVFKGGYDTGLITEYGENDFLITYDDTYYFSFRHFIFNNNSYHDYNFTFKKVGDEMLLTLNIEGEQEVHIESPMHKISEASLHLGNRPTGDNKCCKIE